MISYHDAAHYCQRYTNVVSAAIMQAFRMLVKDYEKRSQTMCTNAYNRLAYVNKMIPGYGDRNADQLHMHPFMRGNFVGGLVGDAGDEDLLMCGRVNDFGTYRAEKNWTSATGTLLARSFVARRRSRFRHARTARQKIARKDRTLNITWWRQRAAAIATAALSPSAGKVPDARA